MRVTVGQERVEEEVWGGGGEVWRISCGWEIGSLT